jgi:hypothetical protein
MDRTEHTACGQPFSQPVCMVDPDQEVREPLIHPTAVNNLNGCTIERPDHRFSILDPSAVYPVVVQTVEKVMGCEAHLSRARLQARKNLSFSE